MKCYSAVPFSENTLTWNCLTYKTSVWPALISQNLDVVNIHTFTAVVAARYFFPFRKQAGMSSFSRVMLCNAVILKLCPCRPLAAVHVNFAFWTESDNCCFMIGKRHLLHWTQERNPCLTVCIRPLLSRGADVSAGLATACSCYWGDLVNAFPTWKMINILSTSCVFTGLKDIELSSAMDSVIVNSATG